MKKLSFFLMAMLFSVMSFAAEVTVKISDYATTNGWKDATQYKTLKMDDNVSITVAGGSNTGKYYNNGNNWRMYQNESPKITLTATNGNLLKTVKFTYAAEKTGILVDASKAQVKSGTVYTFADEVTTYTFGVGNTGTATNGQVRFTEITVVYDAPTPSDPDAVKYTVTAKVNDPAMGAVSGAGEYAEGKTATLTANANAGYRFVNWSNGSTDNPLKITVTENIEITANFEAVPPMTCAEAAAAASGATVVLNPFDVVAVVKDAGYIYIKDESGVNLIFDYNLDDKLKAGDHVEGFVGVSSPYNGLPEIKPSVSYNDLTITSGTAPEPTLFTEAPVKADVNKYVKFENVTFTANVTYTAGSTGSNATMVVNGTNVTVRNTFKLAATLSKDKAYNLVGFVAVYNSTIQVYFLSVEEYVAPVVNHTITVSANPAEAGVVTGGGEFEETDEITVKAVANEGYEFVNWTENEEEVSTDAEYTFAVLADRNLVANFVEAAPEINYEEFIMSNLVVTTPAEGLEMLEASDPVNGISVMLGVYEDGTLHEDCLITFQGTELSIVSSEKVTKEYNEDVETDVYTVRVVVAFGGANMGLQLLMYATAAAEPIIINVEGATVTLTEYQISAEETAYELNMISNWVYEEDGLTYEVECLLPTFDPTKESGDYEASFFVRGEGNAFGMTEDAIVSVAKNGNQITLTGEITAYNNNVYNVTISGTLPVVEPTTITWELNGGEVAAVVPTNEELWEAFKPYYNTYYGLERADQPITAVASFASAKMQEIMTDPESEYKWLGDYVLSVAAEQGVTVDSELTWRFSVHTFFNAEKRTAYPSNVPDFTEAGKPENWGPAYQAAHEVVLPTEPVAEDYVLPTPVKEGYTFVGWYDNADGEGEAMTVLPAGWAGTLYAIWKVEGPATALENIAVEGKAVKAIVNGQLIIIKNGVQYNAQGQVVK